MDRLRELTPSRGSLPSLRRESLPSYARAKNPSVVNEIPACPPSGVTTMNRAQRAGPATLRAHPRDIRLIH